MQNQILIELSISAQDYQRWYSGHTSLVLARALDGRRVQFPAHSLQRHVQHHGIYGRFELIFDEQHRFIALNRAP
ncbi:MAG: DUF2835 domain-containing protein [Pseudomonadota bacterium]